MKIVTRIVALSSFALFVVACSGGSEGSSSSGGTSSGGQGSGDDGSGNGRGSGSGSGSGSNGSGDQSQSTGQACSSGDACANWVCRCNDGAVVNSTLCVNGYCQGPKAHCEKACKTFGHGGWSGQASGGDEEAKPNDPPAGSCKSQSDCASFECGCTNGSRISVRDCYQGSCLDAMSGCQSACSDSGRGDWDGT